MNIPIPRTILTALACLIVAVSLLQAGCGDNDKQNKIILFGVDGAEWDILLPMVEAGRLPNFAKIIEGGASGSLESFTPMLSPVIWTSIATGKGMQAHGISWFMIRDPETGDLIPVTSRNRKVKALWNILTDRNRSVGIIGWWASWPPEQVNGFIVSDHVAYHGFGVHTNPDRETSDKTYPPELMQTLAPLMVQPAQVTKADVQRFMDTESTRYSFPSTERFEFDNPIHHFMYIYSTMKSYEAVGLELLKSRRPDLFAVYFEGVDTTGHFFMRFAPPKVQTVTDEEFSAFNKVVERVYEEQDRILSRYLEAADEDTTVILVSDHGFKQGDERSEIVLGTNTKAAQIWHQIDGVAILYGNNIRPGTHIEGASVLDIAPTILYLLGEPVPEDMEGKILEAAIDPTFVARNPVKHVPTFEGSHPVLRQEVVQDAKVNEEIRERLKALGYISGGAADKETADALAAPVEQAEKAIDVGQWEEKTLTLHGRKNRILYLIRTARFADALAEIDRGLAEDPKDVEMIAFRGDAYRMMGNYDGAIEVYRNAVPKVDKEETDPVKKAFGLAELHGKLAEMALAQGEMDEAKTLIDKALGYSKDNALAHYALSEYYILTRQYEKAIAALHESKALSPENIFVFNMLGECYMKMGQPDAAETNLKVVLSLDPTFAKSLYNLGLIAYERKNMDQAKAFFEKALRYKGNYPNQLFYLGNIYFGEGNLGKAGFYYENAAKVEPGNWEIWLNLGRLAKFSQQPDKMKEYMEKAYKLAPGGNIDVSILLEN